ncbi:S41 family peptidase [Clostridiales bacterium FE2011]|nr:S41 family peptidase [Clostridiales bacterium FE2011]QTE75180.1 S41 family peptidase [Clostridiales bacterium FE2010]
MRKKMLKIICVMAMLLVLSSCSLIPISSLESMFNETGNSSITSGYSTGSAAKDSNVVIISKDEYEKYQKFSEMFTIYDTAKDYFYQEPDTDLMVEYAIRGMMAGLDDPYSFYYNPKEYKEMMEDDEGKYVGIGVMIQANMEKQICTITRVFQGGPAEEAGVQRGDILYRVGEDLYVNPTNLQEAVDIMRGIPGTDVDVTFLRNGEEITYTITRREVNVNQVDSKMLDDKIGYIAMYEFAGHSELEFEQALQKLLAQKAQGIIIDLRDNQGGWVEQARYIADLFMDEGELCYLKYRDGEEHADEYRTKNGKADVKLVILINENSASSSEILTGALRDCAGAVTVGVKSFGKGIIQMVSEVGVNGAGFQMTIAEYLTPSGTPVHKIGITPDYEVPLPEGDNGMYDFADTVHDIQLAKAVEVMKEQLH